MDFGATSLNHTYTFERNTQEPQFYADFSAKVNTDSQNIVLAKYSHCLQRILTGDKKLLIKRNIILKSVTTTKSRTNGVIIPPISSTFGFISTQELLNWVIWVGEVERDFPHGF